MPITPAERQIQLTIPQCEFGLGTIIMSPTGKGLIEGVRISPMTVWPDDRGVFFEVARVGCGLVEHFAPESTQISATFSYRGTIKAFHYHRQQWDCWIPSAGMLQVALIDLREESDTFGFKNTLFAGEHRPWQLLIPPGVAHGYKVIGEGKAGLIYVTSRFYNPEDEGRLPYNDARLGYDWTIQHK